METAKTGDRGVDGVDVDCLLFSGMWDERQSLSRTDSRISRIVYNVRREVLLRAAATQS